MFDNVYRAEFHSARVKAVLTVLDEARREYKPIGLCTACAVAALALGESHATIYRSWHMAANLREQEKAANLVASRGEAKATRIGHDADDLVRKVREALKKASLTMAITAVAAETRYSPGWVGVCERQARNGKAVTKKRLKPQLYLVSDQIQQGIAA
jgi:spore germination protein YaaH